MDVLKMLQTNPEELIPEDLDFFETELATGGPYDSGYLEQCRNKIGALRKWMKGEDEPAAGDASNKADHRKKSSGGPLMRPDQVVPDGALGGNIVTSMTPRETVYHDIKIIRTQTDYKSAFKKYVKDSRIIDADFLDNNMALFDSWELNSILSVKQLGEAFLEKYFGTFNHDKIARYQLFSENFFMKHFTQMNAEVVLEHGKNDWRKKENRSKQLDVFLRLKGVKI